MVSSYAVVKWEPEERMNRVLLTFCAGCWPQVVIQLLKTAAQSDYVLNGETTE